MITASQENNMNLQAKETAPNTGTRPRLCFPISCMKLMALSLAALVLVMGITLSSVGEAREGNESHGGGTENIHPNGPAWFFGNDRTIRACVVVMPDFKLVPDTFPAETDPKDRPVLTKQDAVRLLREAHGKWATYVDERGAQPKRSGGDLEFSLKMEVLEECNSDEDLRVYFGLEDEIVKAAKARFREPFGFALTVGKAESRYWRKGIIWIAPPGPVGNRQAIWTYRRLVGELLHEIGHTLGSGHVPGTVMDGEIGRVFSEMPRQYFSPDFTIDQIDQERTLLLGEEVQRMSRIIDWGNAPDGSSVLKPFEMLMKRARKGEIKSSVEYKGSWKGRRRSVSGTFSLGDAAGTRVFALEAETPFRCHRVGNSIFAHYTWKDSNYMSALASESCQYSGKIIDKGTGESYAVSIDENANLRRFLVMFADSEEYFPLFDYNPPWNTACAPNPACSLIVKPKK